MKKQINVYDYARKIVCSIDEGILITTKVDEKVNSMVISWGTIGIQWGKLIFVAYVRENRFTKVQLDKHPEFTVNIPLEKLDAHIYKVCGRQSGFDIDKVKKLDLTLIESNEISVPGIKEVPITLECKVIYKQAQDKSEILQDILEEYYAKDIEDDFYGSNMDYHTCYYGEIVDAYIIE